MRNIREELEQEASFWREMLEDHQNDVDEIALQRMVDALSLVEYKLSYLVDMWH